MNEPRIFSVELPSIEKIISEDLIRDYAKMSGDFNLVHINREFAETSVFKGIVAHGMMTLGFISDMLIAHFGLDWCNSGSLSVRFKLPARPGDVVRTYGRISRDQSNQTERKIDCTVSLFNSMTNEELIAGTARLKINHEKET